MEEILEFDDETSRVVEEFNSSPGAKERRRRITAALNPQAGEAILDVGCGPGNQIFEMSSMVGPGGRIQDEHRKRPLVKTSETKGEAA